MKKHHVYMIDKGPEEGLHYTDKETYDSLKKCGYEEGLSHKYYYDNKDVERLIEAAKDASSVVNVVAQWIESPVIDGVAAKLRIALGAPR